MRVTGEAENVVVGVEEEGEREVAGVVGEGLEEEVAKKEKEVELLEEGEVDWGKRGGRWGV